MKFSVLIQESDKSDNFFKADINAKDIDAALEFATRGLLEAWLASPQTKPGKPESWIVTLSNSEQTQSWKVVLKIPTETPCGECGGAGGVDSGGMTPQGTGIDIPCPSCNLGERYEKALTDFQNDVWRSLGKYSDQLGWGLTGIQPECWALLDTAIKELVERRKADEQVVRIITRSRCGCLIRKCSKHGERNPEDVGAEDRIIATRQLLPPRQLENVR